MKVVKALNEINMEINSLPLDNIEETNCYKQNSVQSLSQGMVSLFTPPLLGIQEQVDELMKKQLILVEQLHNENIKLSWSQNSPELQDIYNTMKLYNTKLINIKKNMKVLHERNIKLKKRAMKLQQFSEKQLYIRSQKGIN